MLQECLKNKEGKRLNKTFLSIPLLYCCTNTKTIIQININVKDLGVAKTFTHSTQYCMLRHKLFTNFKA